MKRIHEYMNERELPQTGWTTSDRLAEAFGVSDETVRDWLRKYQLPARVLGSKVVIHMETFWESLPAFQPAKTGQLETDSEPTKPDSERTGESGERDRRRTAVTVRQDRGESAGTVGTSRRRKLASNRATTESRIGN